jgi:hypothetical protein
MTRKLASRWLQSLGLIGVISCGAVACGDDETTTVVGEASPSSLPDAGLDAAALDAALDAASGALEAGSAIVDARASNSSRGASAGSVTEPNGTPPVDDTSVAPSDGGAQLLRCAPSKCVCDDPADPDCCHEKLPYQGYVITLQDAGAPAINTHEEQQGPKTERQTRERLWSSFEAGCGATAGCHVGNGTLPWFQFQEFNFEDFPEALIASCKDRVSQSDPAKAMPPGAGSGDGRACKDSYVTVCREMEAFEASGFADEFDVLSCDQPDPNQPQEPQQPSPVGDCSVGPTPYRLSAELALDQTNLGQCIPTQHAESCPTSVLTSKDQLFAAMQGFGDLPSRLSETDLVSLDSEVLAGHRVYSYAPTYTLFSDNAKKQRYVRVPVGQTVSYNEETRDFDIPDNTRFYKTFLKEVKHADGTASYRKMETRLIVVRKDVENADGTFAIKALRATYAWDNEESEAHLVTDPLKNREPWADRLCPMVVDESAPRDPKKNPIIKTPHRECTYMTLDEEDNAESGTIRHYAIPGVRRCDECHMGSNNHSYILGFNPWQVDRRPLGEGGVYDAPNPDELDQLKRFISYGIISGIAPGEAKLEESQGDRAPRSDYELKAQGYMMGNCAFCHAPHGFPSVQNPLLRSLDFFPKPAENGGVFQFPLEKTSPRVKVDKSQTTAINYISTDMKPWNWDKFTAVKRSSLNDGCSLSDYTCNPRVEQYCPPGQACSEQVIASIEADSMMFGGVWGSLIWRNVYTPMTYPDTNTLFIHMPRNVPGFDCRAHNIMADWMLSIPVDETGAQASPTQEYYKRFVKAAETRREDYHNSATGQHCPVDDDIVDPRVLLAGRDPVYGKMEYPAPGDLGDYQGPSINHEGFEEAFSDGTGPFKDGVPDHPHWVSADYSTPPGEWTPKRSDWHRMLTGRANQELLADVNPNNDKLVSVIEDLLTIKSTPEFEAFALEPVPMGIWADSCAGTAQELGARQVKDFAWDARRTIDRWITQGQVDPIPGSGMFDAESYVHEMSRGQAVFEAICMNCHGTNFDSRSPLATTVAELSGGNTLVADFRNGLLGPTEAPGSNASGVFTFSDGNNGATPDDWLARYVLFMGMGGTLAEIPKAVVQLVSATPFYGVLPVLVPSISDANMLEPAALRCADVLSDATGGDGARMEVHFNTQLQRMVVVNSPEDKVFAHGTGQLQLWESLCNHDQRPIIRVLQPGLVGLEQVGDLVAESTADGGTLSTSLYRSWDGSGNDVYPAEALVGDQLGNVTAGIQSTNVLPWCVYAPDAASRDKTVAMFAKVGVAESGVPFCPAEVLAKVEGKALYMFTWKKSAPTGTYEDVGVRDRWFRGGGYNAGLAALSYLKKRASDPNFKPAPAFNSPTCKSAADN